MSTIKQAKAVNLLLDNVRNPSPMTKEQILIEAGYKKISKQPSRVFESKGVQDLLKENKIDYNSRLKRLSQIFYDKDKRASLGANKEITSMLGEYKQTDVKAVALFDKIEKDLKE